jgi:Glyoxalase/Bleomycin resistance protein/Dioxygenase superfamily
MQSREPDHIHDQAGQRRQAMAKRAERVRDLIPFVHVSDLPGVDRFYELLGFEVGDTYEVAGELHWASLRNGDARIMLALAGAPIDPREQAVIFYLNVEDLDGLRERLLAHDLPVGPIRDGSPGPEREIRVSDPDGYCLMIAEEGGTARPPTERRRRTGSTPSGRSALPRSSTRASSSPARSCASTAAGFWHVASRPAPSRLGSWSARS